MSINLEKTVKDWIDTDPDGDGLTAYLEVPADRPKRLVTIERVGGNENEYSSHPTIAVQAWAESRWQAAQLATSQVLPRLLDLDLLDPIAALIVGLMIVKMGWGFTRDAFHDLTDRAVNEEQAAAIAAEIHAIPGVRGIHDLRTRKTGDMIVADVHLEIDGHLTVAEGHEIAKRVVATVKARHPVLHLTTHVDPV